MLLIKWLSGLNLVLKNMPDAVELKVSVRKL
ncbi:MAG: hypothetical protein PWP66_598 [Thermosediminibacterales bacterium]|nr:hypothetical protein [Thermosediminibacterales bacterium]